MPRTVLAQLTATHLLVTLAGVLVVACLSSWIFSTLYVKQRETELIAASAAIAEDAAALL